MHSCNVPAGQSYVSDAPSQVCKVATDLASATTTASDTNLFNTAEKMECRKTWDYQGLLDNESGRYSLKAKQSANRSCRNAPRGAKPQIGASWGCVAILRLSMARHSSWQLLSPSHQIKAQTTQTRARRSRIDSANVHYQCRQSPTPRCGLRFASSSSAACCNLVCRAADRCNVCHLPEERPGKLRRANVVCLKPTRSIRSSFWLERLPGQLKQEGLDKSWGAVGLVPAMR